MDIMLPPHTHRLSLFFFMPEAFFQMSDDLCLFIFKSEAGLVRWQISFHFGSEPASHEDSSIRGGSPCFGTIELKLPTGDGSLAALCVAWELTVPCTVGQSSSLQRWLCPLLPLHRPPS